MISHISVQKPLHSTEHMSNNKEPATKSCQKKNSHIRDTFTTFNTANPTKQPQLENFHSLTFEPFEVLPDGKISWGKGFTLNGGATSGKRACWTAMTRIVVPITSSEWLTFTKNTKYTKEKCYELYWIVKVTNLQPTLHILWHIMCFPTGSCCSMAKLPKLSQVTWGGNST